MKFIKPYLIFLACLACLLSATHALTEQPEVPTVNVTFSFYLAGSQALGSEASAVSDHRKPKEYFILNAGKAQAITLVSGRETRPIRYSGPAAFQLYKADGVDENGEPKYKPVLAIQLPPTWSKGMLALFGKGNHLRVFPLETNKTSERNNSALFYNISGTTVICKAGETKLNLPPFGCGSVSLNSIRSDLQLEIQCAALASEEDWRLVYSGSQTVKKNHFYIFLLTPDATGENFRILRFKAG